MALYRNIRKVGTSLAITLPKAISDILGWERGDNVVIEVNTEEGTLIIKKAGG